MSPDWKKKYFECLFSLKLNPNDDTYTDILRDLYSCRRLKGDKVLAFSFVSKLVAIHDESRPLYDRHIRAFFGIEPPETGSIDFKIQGFIRNLGIIRENYMGWSSDQDFIDILATFRKNHPAIKSCHDSRLFDFLVWGVGHYRIV